MSLTTSKKIVYMRHKHFLLEGHRYRMRKMDKYFDNNDELHSTAPSGNNKGQRVFEIVRNIKLQMYLRLERRRKYKHDAKANAKSASAVRGYCSPIYRHGTQPI